MNGKNYYCPKNLDGKNQYRPRILTNHIKVGGSRTFLIHMILNSGQEWVLALICLGKAFRKPKESVHFGYDTNGLYPHIINYKDLKFCYHLTNLISKALK